MSIHYDLLHLYWNMGFEYLWGVLSIDHDTVAL